jgi:hypothetical protein
VSTGSVHQRTARADPRVVRDDEFRECRTGHSGHGRELGCGQTVGDGKSVHGGHGLDGRGGRDGRPMAARGPRTAGQGRLGIVRRGASIGKQVMGQGGKGLRKAFLVAAAAAAVSRRHAAASKAKIKMLLTTNFSSRCTVRKESTIDVDRALRLEKTFLHL